MAFPDSIAVHDAFILLCSFFALCLKFGFAFVEAGKTDPKNVSNVIFKNVADTFVTLLAFFLHGYAFAFGEHNAVIGTQFFLTLNETNMVNFFFNYVRCAVATTLALGAANERTEPIGYLISAYVFSGIIYPLACHWVWDQQGIFSPTSTSYPSQDYAGSGVIFLLGGAAAAVSLRVIGSRAGRWSPHFKRTEHSQPMVVLGGCLQMLGFLGLVIGTHPRVLDADEGLLLGLGTVNLLHAATSGGLYGLMIQRIDKNYYDLDSMLSGAIAGMVAVCAGVDTYMPGVAVMCGATGSLLFIGFRRFLCAVKLDDPLNIVSGYLIPGAWGLMLAGLFSDHGALGGHIQVLGNNCIVALVLFFWAVAIMYPLLSILMCFGVLRVPRFMEKQGIDKIRHTLRHPHGTRKSLN
ncbi:putative ammonium transporter 1 isoform X1 [Salmo trutta]|uniref:putative ammonium transporter 1 isoform X1 n=1 Tax=Salmo trutta TaxID=8032 RepID=UPI001131139E|nr:putative ammonium transporter 1 isoform X1 [Salmo trutta]